MTHKLPSGKVVMDDFVSNLFLNGTIFAKILQKILDEGPSSLDKILSTQKSIENLSTPSKLYNWNLVCESLKKINIIVEQDIKNLIVAGDMDIVNEILHEIYEKCKDNYVICT